jgi:ParB-like chromosome segregation protein Spo0J
MAEERIPRRDPPAFEELEDANLLTAIREHGLLRTALSDSNQFGPQGMILMLVITATLTGLALLLLMKL